MTRDIYIAIMVADAKSSGLRLTADEVGQLAADEAIRMAALNGLDDRDWPGHGMHAGPSWAKIDPARDRAPGNLAAKAPEDIKNGRQR